MRDNLAQAVECEKCVLLVPSAVANKGRHMCTVAGISSKSEDALKFSTRKLQLLADQMMSEGAVKEVKDTGSGSINPEARELFCDLVDGGKVRSFSIRTLTTIRRGTLSDQKEDDLGTTRERFAGFVVFLNKRGTGRFNDVDCLVLQTVGQISSRILTNMRVSRAARARDKAWQQNTKRALLELGSERDEIQNAYSLTLTELESSRTMLDERSAENETLAKQVERTAAELQKKREALDVLRKESAQSLRAFAERVRSDSQKAQDAFDGKLQTLKKKALADEEALLLQLRECKDNAGKRLEEAADKEAVLKSERAALDEKYREERRAHKVQLVEIDRRIRRLQQTLGILQKRCKTAEGERDALNAALSKEKALAVIQIQEAHDNSSAALVEATAAAENQREIARALRDNLSASQKKYEFEMEKHNSRATSSNGMLVRIESQLREVTDSLQARNDEVRDLQSKLSVAESARTRMRDEKSAAELEILRLSETLAPLRDKESELSEGKDRIKHLEATISMMRKSLDECRAKRTELSAKISRITPAHSATELELQKSVDAQVELQQELMALRRELQSRTTENVRMLKDNTALKKQAAVQNAGSDELQAQITRLRQLKVKAEQDLRNAAAVAAKDLEDKSAEALRFREAKNEKDEELRRVRGQKMQLESQLAASIRHLADVSFPGRAIASRRKLFWK